MAESGGAIWIGVCAVAWNVECCALWNEVECVLAVTWNVERCATWNEVVWAVTWNVERCVMWNEEVCVLWHGM